MTEMQEINELLHDCTLWAKEAGRVQLEYFRGKNLDIKAKFNDSDIVTAADKASEEIIISNIRKNIPPTPSCRKNPERVATKATTAG